MQTMCVSGEDAVARRRTQAVTPPKRQALPKRDQHKMGARSRASQPPRQTTNVHQALPPRDDRIPIGKSLRGIDLYQLQIGFRREPIRHRRAIPLRVGALRGKDCSTRALIVKSRNSLPAFDAAHLRHTHRTVLDGATIWQAR